MSLLGPSGLVQRIPIVIPARTPRYIDLTAQWDLQNTPFSISIESTTQIVVDRVQELSGGGAHAERAIDPLELRSGREWVIAEGTTAAGFNLFYLISNPNDAPVRVELTYYFAAAQPPVSKTLTVAPMSRHTIWVNQEGPELADRDVSVRLTADAPIIAEYAMYRPATSGQGTAALAARGHVVSNTGYQVFAESATGPFFDTFIAIANTLSAPVAVPFRYLLPDGQSVRRTYTVPAHSRYTVWADQDPELKNTSFGFEVNTLPGVAVQRTMLWPGDAAGWYEGHTSGSSTLKGDLYAAWGESSRSTDCYFLIANPLDASAVVDVTLLLESGETTSRALVIAAGARADVSVGQMFPESAGGRFAARVSARDGAAIAVDQSTYRTPNSGPLFAQGSSKPLK